MTTVEVKFTAHSAKHNAKPGDTKKVDVGDVAGLEAGGVAAPTKKSEADKAK